MTQRGGIRLRGKIWHISYYHNGIEYRETTRSTKRTDAVKLLAQRRADLARGLAAHGATRKHTVGAFLERLEEEYLLRGGRSLRSYRAHLKRLAQGLGGKRLVELDAFDVSRFIREQQEAGRARGTIGNSLTLLRQVVQLALQEGIIHRPVPIPSLRSQNVRQGFWEPEEFKRLLAAAPDWLADVAGFGYLTGWRKKEVLELTWERVDLKARALLLSARHTKTGRGRRLVMVGPLLALLERRRGVARPGVPVFHKDGRRITPSILERAWKRACVQSGNAGKYFHDFRRTAARNMSKAGVPVRVAMEITGHSTQSTYQRYNIVDEGDMEAALHKTYAWLDAQGETPKVVQIGRKS